MATKTDKALDEIRKLLKTKKLVMGTQKSIKGLKSGKVGRIFYAANCPDLVRNDIEQYSKIGNVEAVGLDVGNAELGVICKKPFSISVISIMKE